MKTKRSIIEIDEEKCNGCGLCVPSCAEGAIQIVNGKARLVADKHCDGLGACLGECPMGALRIVEREADAFVEPPHMAAPAPQIPAAPVPHAHAGGCPGRQAMSWKPSGGGCPGAAAARVAQQQDGDAALSHWPVQIRLVSPMAPFLQGADLLVTADCVPVALPNFQNYVRDRVVMLGCPKFDDVDMYVDRFAEIFAMNDVRSVTVLVMEVPCCQGLPLVVREGMERAGKSVPVAKHVVARTGEILSVTRL